MRFLGPPPSTPVDVPVSYVISASAPQVTVAPSLLRFLSRANTPNTYQQSFLLRNPGGGGAVPVSVAVANNSPWITKVSASAPSIQQNSPVLVTVSIDTHGLAATIFHDAIHVTTSLGAFDVPVSLFVIGRRNFHVRCHQMERDLSPGKEISSPRNQRVSVRNLGDVSTMLNWTASVLRGARPGDRLASRRRVPAGRACLVRNQSEPHGSQYRRRQVRFDSGFRYQRQETRRSISSSWRTSRPLIRPLCRIPIPRASSFTASAGTASQVSTQQISVGTNSADPVPFFVSTSTDDGGQWLNAVASSATTSQTGPAQIAVSLSTGSLTARIVHRPGEYQHRGSGTLGRGDAASGV